MKISNKSAFSLVELSIVIIIIGLLFAGVSGGSKLIKSAKLSKIMRDISSTDTSILAFLQAYDAYPGDFKDATLFWGTTGLANGDGDGRIELNTSSTTNDEVSNAMLHLQKAELIEGTFDSTISSANYAFKGELNSNMILLNELDSTGTSLGGFSSIFSSKNVIMLGIEVSSSRYTGDTGAINAFISPRDMYSLDNKFDDGNGISGKISFRDESAIGGNVEPSSCADAATGIYVSSEDDGCNLVHKIKI